MLARSTTEGIQIVRNKRGVAGEATLEASPAVNTNYWVSAQESRSLEGRRKPCEHAGQAGMSTTIVMA